MAVAAAAIAGYAILEEHELWRRAFAELALIALERVLLPKSRDGGTGRRSGLKIRRKQFHGGSIPPPGTIYPYYFQQLTSDKAELLTRFGYKIGYSAHPACFQ